MPRLLKGCVLRGENLYEIFMKRKARQAIGRFGMSLLRVGWTGFFLKKFTQVPKWLKKKKKDSLRPNCNMPLAKH